MKPSQFDIFFRANYRGMVGYCCAFGYREADVEEEVADVILGRFDEYLAEIEGPNPMATMRRWMNRRALLNLKTRYSRHGYTKVSQLPDDAEVLHFEDPESILDVKQRLPEVHPILISYEPFAGAVSARGENTSADKTRFCRERKKFLTALKA